MNFKHTYTRNTLGKSARVDVLFTVELLKRLNKHVLSTPGAVGKESRNNFVRRAVAALLDQESHD
jgi:hypothetical protein